MILIIVGLVVSVVLLATIGMLISGRNEDHRSLHGEDW